MKTIGKCFICCLPVLIILLGGYLRTNNATSFLGLICWIFTAIILLYGFLLKLNRKFMKTAWRMTVVLTVVLIVGFVIVTVTGVLVGVATTGNPVNDLEYIVVLGAKVNGTEPSRTLRERIDAAAAYLQNNPDTIAVVSGGQGSDEGISEAQCIYHGLIQRGIESRRIWLEDQATSTWENLTYSLDLIEERTGLRPARIGLLSSEFHLYRGTLFAQKCGVQAYGIPAKTGNPVYFLNYFLREIAGVWHYIILGK